MGKANVPQVLKRPQTECVFPRTVETGSEGPPANKHQPSASRMRTQGTSQPQRTQNGERVEDIGALETYPAMISCLTEIGARKLQARVGSGSVGQTVAKKELCVALAFAHSTPGCTRQGQSWLPMGPLVGQVN